MSQRGFLTEMLLHIYHAVGKLVSGFLFTLLFTNYENIYLEFLLFHNTYSNFFFKDFDVTTFIIHQITFRIIKSNQLKCCK